MTADVNTPETPLVEWVALTIDYSDPLGLADFYVHGIGADLRRQSEDSAWVVLDSLPIILRAIPGYRSPSWPSSDVPLQSHFEVVVHDPDDAAARLTKHGASEAYRDPDDPHYVVMRDPAGQPFCLIRSSHARRP